MAEMLSGQKLKSCYTIQSKCQKNKTEDWGDQSERCLFISMRTGAQFLEPMLLKRAGVMQVCNSTVGEMDVGVSLIHHGQATQTAWSAPGQ